MAERKHLPRLSLALQQPLNGGMYSPALPTSLQQTFHPPFPSNLNPLQTPMQSFFTPNQPPTAPIRPGHRPNQASLQLAAAGIHPPQPFMPLHTPLATHFPHPSLVIPQQLPHPNRNRRQQSIGGPPKAVLGGPQRKVSPLPPATATAAATPGLTTTPVPPPVKQKKVVINLPKESIVTPKDGEEPEVTHPEWARIPLRPEQVPTYPDIPPVETTSAESYPSDAYRHGLPVSIDVYLPGKLAWEAIKRKGIEEKLEKLGVEPPTIPHIHAPHARAASISSLADPALLLFKLNKLQQSQEASLPASLSVSPQPPFAIVPGPLGGLSPSPRPPRFVPGAASRHGHALSLAQVPSYQSSLYSVSPGPINPYGSNLALATESVAESSDNISEQGQTEIWAPHAQAPIGGSAPPISAVGGNKSHVDFIRGFGLDVPLESEEEGEQEETKSNDDEAEADKTQDMELDNDFGRSAHISAVEADTDADVEQENDVEDTISIDEATTAPHTRLHSRHASKLSAALSLRSLGGRIQPESNDNDVEDAVAEWTGSEDVGGASDDESVGEWSNPSDEERARQQRLERRMRKHRPAKHSASSLSNLQHNSGSPHESYAIDQPRRLPDFPPPPRTNPLFNGEPTLAMDDDDIISNPSEEGMIMAQRAEFMGVRTEEYYAHPNQHNHSHTQGSTHTFGHAQGSSSTFGPPSSNFAAPHSRATSGQYSMHDPAMAHSRTGSENFTYAPSMPQPQVAPAATSPPTTARRDSLNPFAKPFVFGASRGSPASVGAVPASNSGSGSWQPFAGQHHLGLVSPPASSASATFPSFGSNSGHSRVPSLGKPLNIAAPEFKPGGSFGALASSNSLSSHLPTNNGGSGSGAFSFQLAGAPTMPAPPPDLSRFSFPPHAYGEEGLHAHSVLPPIPAVPSAESTPFKTQGREKRQRVVSPTHGLEDSEAEFDVADDEDEEGHELNAKSSAQRDREDEELIEEGDSMASFRFPPMKLDGSPQSIRRSASNNNMGGAAGVGSKPKLNPTAQPFTFAGFAAVANNMPWVPKEGVEREESVRDESEVDGDVDGEDGEMYDDADEDKENDASRVSMPVPVPFRHQQQQQVEDEEVNDNSTAKPDGSLVHDQAATENNKATNNNTLPATTKKRAPIPLDFKHPISTNTVPAGLFKALANPHSAGGSGSLSGINPSESQYANLSNNATDARTRRGVRSRLSSREIFEHMHRPSMDDLTMPMIAKKHPYASQQHSGFNSPMYHGGQHRVVTDPGSPAIPADDVFGSVHHNRRRSSLPDALVDPDSLPSNSNSHSRGPASSVHAPQFELHHFESVVEGLLDEKLSMLKRELMRREQNGESRALASQEKAVGEMVELFRARLVEIANRNLEGHGAVGKAGDSEVDVHMLKLVVEESHREVIKAFQREAQQIAAAAASASSAASGSVAADVAPLIESIGGRTINAVVEAISELSARQEAVANNAPARERDMIVDKLMGILTPMLHSLRSEPVDYEFLTRELTQAVKPHISQLIDLASDKRETAGLIVDQIMPLMPDPRNFTFDTDAVTLKLITEVRRAIAPIDAFEIKEQVADLVVERLDSRLAVRDKAFNVDVVTSRVTESVEGLLKSLYEMPAALDTVSAAQKEAEKVQSGLAATQAELKDAVLVELPKTLASQIEGLKASQEQILQKIDQPQAVSAPEPDSNVLIVKEVVEKLAVEQHKLALQSDETVSQNKALMDKISGLPDSFKDVAASLQAALTELITSRDTSQRELEELRKVNTEHQVQVAKARGAHGQVRVEKDMLAEKLNSVEADRDRLRAQVKELEKSASDKAKETSALEVKNADLEAALAKALERLQDSDVAGQQDKHKIADLEKANKELVEERHGLIVRVESLEAEVKFAFRERDSALKAHESLQKQQQELIAQQGQWELLNAATEKINMVYHLLEGADSEEQKELRLHQDRNRALETENLAMQKRMKELEAKVANSDRAAATARQNLTQAQQRSADWEHRAKEYEGQVEMIQTRLEQTEQTQQQLEADYNTLKEEQEADNRLAQDHKERLQAQISALESKCSVLQNELEKANAARHTTPPTSTPYRTHTNGAVTHPPPRPDSRTSTIHDGRGGDLNRRVSSSRNALSSSQNSQPAQSVRDSMHAPSTNGYTSSTSSKYASPSPYVASRYVYTPSTPKARHSGLYNSFNAARGPSPTPSVVSAVPTQGEDGWWS
ncbi:hypothetical protein CVT24_000475 [Panaeolus cyanescens]|uniref:Uncharacterized protein n=1 Tax=Panaeolus cyanescens TaxID=181874 RepID=A0A409V8D2_9AGAR|nr:hypothetical protein CVT24_000475 [Panaeolus cyanescens]